ncbi:MAG: hypothetical protein IPH41_00805 [Sulfuritalea sp.]|jgi:hypothetical protein|nr:hypothetical protein [Sulfuritalea sp.]
MVKKSSEAADYSRRGIPAAAGSRCLDSGIRRTDETAGFGKLSANAAGAIKMDVEPNRKIDRRRVRESQST